METMKFLSPADVLQHVSLVSALWNSTAESDELWWHFCGEALLLLRDGIPPKSLYRDSMTDIRLLAYVSGLKVKVFSPKTNSLTKYNLKQCPSVNHENAYCFLTKTTIICFGAGGLPEVKEINLQTRSVTLLPSMHELHLRPGILKIPQFIYVFGGKTRSCERFNISAKRWEVLSEFLSYPLEAVTPARHRSQVFIVGPSSIEVFSLESETFSLLPLSPPTTWWYTLAFVCKEELIVVQRDVIGRWTIDSGEQSFRRTPVETGASGLWSNSAPIWYDGKFYSIHNDIPYIKGVLMFDPQTNKLKTIVNKKTLL